MVTELIAPVFTIVIGYLIRAALRALKVEFSEAQFNTLVAAIVVYLLALAGIQTAVHFGLLAG